MKLCLLPSMQQLHLSQYNCYFFPVVLCLMLWHACISLFHWALSPGHLTCDNTSTSIVVSSVICNTYLSLPLCFVGCKVILPSAPNLSAALRWNTVWSDCISKVWSSRLCLLRVIDFAQAVDTPLGYFPEVIIHSLWFKDVLIEGSARNANGADADSSMWWP